MDEEPQVFSSNITRRAKPLKSNLSDLLKIVPAQPIVQKKIETRGYCDFKPKTKFYEPKKRSRLKVLTVRNIRHIFEKDVYATLLGELEKQQNVLLRKIKSGARDENTKTLTKNMLKCDKPVSRSAWQMLMNLNPEECAYSTQFVLWNGKRIRVNGSKGGSCKFMCKYDLGTKHLSMKTKSSTCKPFKKIGLLQNSLSVNFTPGPLGKKKYLDHSYQKYHVGNIEVKDLPKPALEIQPTLGKMINPLLLNFIDNRQQMDGTISEKWAEFSVSTLSTVKNEAVAQVEDECCVTFDLNYKYDQQKLLMRRDLNSDFSSISQTEIIDDGVCNTRQDTDVLEIHNILDKIIDAVEISVEQDNMYTGEDEPREDEVEEPVANSTNTQPKEVRLKRKTWNSKELERLDVTIIRLSESDDKKEENTCTKLHCNLGCICTSLQCTYNLKRHCGRIECMFECKCDFSKYKVFDSFERDCSELLPGLLKLDNEVSSKMAKEEQKFHHTVIVTSEKSMLLKSKRRDWKSSRKYADFYSSMCLKSEVKPEKVPTLLIEKLNFSNVEPWCMAHGLYKCFCKGRFTEKAIDVKSEETNADNAVQPEHASVDLTDEVEKTNVRNERQGLKTRMSNSLHRNVSNTNALELKHDLSDLNSHVIHDFSCRSARVQQYLGRKYSNEYYFNANRKISEMEDHDKTLRKRMIHLMNVSVSKDEAQLQSTEGPVIPNKLQVVPELPPLTPAPSTPPKSSPLLAPPLTSPPVLTQPQPASNIVPNTRINLFTNRLPNKEKLVTWLEMSYKHYKQRTSMGIVKLALDPPVSGKMALYPWEFILSRYRERKNLFLITTTPPYRLFMAVDPKHAFFKDCININDIRFADLLKYPVTVKNLLTNAKDLKDNFCILCGLSYCWELIGSVTKMGEQQTNNEELSDEESIRDDSEMSTGTYQLDSEDSNSTTASLDQRTTEVETTSREKNVDETEDSSRWFVMTIENDFEEIQFYNKGFFVKLESIIKAINVARGSKKTVRLSSQKCADQIGPQFGIYAIPNENESCVFVGPYERDESLGIETVKRITDFGKQRRTRGVWITTKKLENFNVIDDPLSFMPPKNLPDAKMMTLAGDSLNTEKTTDSFVEVSQKGDRVKDQHPRFKAQQKAKVLKPIKITKTNNFYQLAPNGTLKQISQQHFNEAKQKSLSSTHKVINTSMLKPPEKSNAPLLNNTSSILNRSPKRIPPTIVTITKKPVAEIAPHVKQISKAPGSTPAPKPNEPTKKEGGMFILKPEEINKRLLQTQVPTNLEHLSVEAQTAMDSDIEMDIENFLATAEECGAPNEDILIISDDETDVDEEINVWFECKTVEGLGWIRGKKNAQGFLSFEFPGFKFTEFYKEEEALAKLTQVLSRKIYIPKTVSLEWRVVESEQDLGNKEMLKQEELGPNFVMTKRGIRHKQELINNKLIKKETDKITSSNIKSEEGINTSPRSSEKPLNIVKLEAESQMLEEEGELLWNTLKSKHSMIGEGLKEVDELREQIAARLQGMMSEN